MSEFLKIVSSQYKHLPYRSIEFIDKRVISDGNTLRNQPFSFQVLYKSKNDACEPVTVSAETELPIAAWRVDSVAVLNPRATANENAYESTLPGLYPDILMPRPAKPEIGSADTAWNRKTYFEKDTDNLLNASNSDYQSVWFTINPDSKKQKAGKYTVNIKLTSLNTLETIDEVTLRIEIINALLPEQTAYYTNWFHVDCVCDMFGVKAYSNDFYKIFDEYIKNMTKHRQNVLLLPAFTPPLDTAVGRERANVQLVDIKKTADGWNFGFEKMRRFVRHAKKHGIKVFEHCHLFSQWGAKNSPNIYDSEGNRIFGYDTDAAGEEYTAFIRAYLVEFFKFAKEEKIDNSLIFHISDEPKISQLESYRTAHDRVSDLLSGNPVCDAMSALDFAKEGLVDHSILSVNHMDNYDFDSPYKIWLYYTGGEINTSNRKISNTAAATGVIGIHMYKYKALGFLQWAYNFYYDRLSFGFADPKMNPSAYKNFPGVTYLCYPINAKGKRTVVPSIREKLMGEAMDDLRALYLLESLIGRERTLAVCEEKLGEINTYTIPKADDLYELRREINSLIAKNI